MTQPNPTDDLEAVVYRACSDYHAAFYGPVATRPARRVQAVKDGVEAIFALRPAGVGADDPHYEVDVQYEVWCGPNMEAASDDLNEARRYEAQYQPCSLLKATTYRQPVGLPDATPAHPDAALMERVRTVLEPFAKAGDLFDAHDYVNRDACIYRPAAGDDYSLDSGHLLEARALLSDLKAEAGR